MKVLPNKKQAVDDENTLADRPDRELMYVLNGLSMEAVQMISPRSLFAWKEELGTKGRTRNRDNCLSKEP